MLPQNLIQSNLKIGASLLDNYISETLKKESKVVENWVDALFLQQIDFKYDIEQLRNIIGLVPQNPTLFEGTIRSNMCWRKNKF